MYADGVLQSWKQIANYVGRTERTVQRWEREFGFPIRRPSGKARSAVMALVSEIEEWTRGRPSLIEIQQTGHCEKFAAPGGSYNVRHNTVRNERSDAPLLPGSDIEGNVTQQAITMNYLSLLSQYALLHENLANFQKALQQQAMLHNGPANTRRECRRINEKVRRTMAVLDHFIACCHREYLLGHGYAVHRNSAQ